MIKKKIVNMTDVVLIIEKCLRQTCRQRKRDAAYFWLILIA